MFMAGIGLLLLVGLLVYGYWCAGSLPVIAWETNDGAIHLQYKPVKDLAMIWVGPSYAVGAERDWVIVEAGATTRRFLPYAAPEPTSLFDRANLHQENSDPVALVLFHQDAGPFHKEQVENALFRLAKDSTELRDRLLEIADRQRLRWLSRCLEE